VESDEGFLGFCDQLRLKCDGVSIIGNGCASVLNTTFSNGSKSSGENKRYRYFRVSDW
jgi:hypothetical protein